MRVALDSNRYVDLTRGDTATVELIETADRVFVPLMVLGELRAGLSIGRRGQRNELVLRKFLMKAGVEVLSPDEDTTLHYANLYRQLRQQGTPIPVNDLWIAALVVQHGLALAARDAHFDRLPQLVRV